MISGTLDRGTEETESTAVTQHRKMKIDGIEIFYRERGPIDAPVVLLLDGLPRSFCASRTMIPTLADRYRVIAPDYPERSGRNMEGCVRSATAFDRFADLVDGLLERLGVAAYAMYVMDCGAPVGWRLALKRRRRIIGLVIQSGTGPDTGWEEARVIDTITPTESG